MDLTVAHICHDTRYTPSNVSYFETGKGNNAVLLFWYIAHGFDPQKDFRTENPLVKMSAAELLALVGKDNDE